MDKADIDLTRKLVETEIGRKGTMESFMIRAGLLVDILDRLERFEKAAKKAIEAIDDADLRCAETMQDSRDDLSDALSFAARIPVYQSLSSAPKDGSEVYLRTPKGAEVRAVWWAGWVGNDDPHPWAWRVSRPDGTVGEPVTEADGWRPLK